MNLIGLGDKRLLYLSARQLTAYAWRGGVLRSEATFPTGQEGLAAFEKYVAAGRSALWFLVADLIEEDYAQELIPQVRGKDRNILLSRKIAQRYRDTSLALAQTLGVEKGERSEERILFSSFTNTQQFHPWLQALQVREVRLAGVFSVALAAPLAGVRLGVKHPSFIMVSITTAGLRQSYVDQGTLRFSRLGRTESSDPDALAAACAAETSRLQQYLASLRILTRDSGPIDVIVIAPTGAKAQFERGCQSNARLAYRVLAIDEACATAKFKQLPETAGAEQFYLLALAAARILPRQYADRQLRRFYNLWRARIGIVAGAAAAFCVMFAIAAYRFQDSAFIDEQTLAARGKEAEASRMYAKIQTTFPKTPLRPESLRVLVNNFALVEAQTAEPRDIILDISRALTDVPEIEIDRLDWQLVRDIKPFASKGRQPEAAQAAPKPPVPATGAAAKGAPEPRFHVAEISGRINVAQASDYRNITAIAERFIDRLRQRPGIFVIAVRLPFDITAEKSLQGVVGAERQTAAPQFSVVISKPVRS